MAFQVSSRKSSSENQLSNSDLGCPGKPVISHPGFPVWNSKNRSFSKNTSLRHTGPICMPSAAHKCLILCLRKKWMHTFIYNTEKKKWSQNGSTPVSWNVTQLHPWHYLREKNGSTLQSGTVSQNFSTFFLSEHRSAANLLTYWKTTGLFHDVDIDSLGPLGVLCSSYE